ncbi:MAG: AsmA family protein [Halieaceae bacterium]|nr:AsmA family protein [Halieaceae bacterium]
MKRLLFLCAPLLLLAALLHWGDRIAARLLDAELPHILSRELGIPVTLGPTRVRLLKLVVSSPELVMGNPADPAIRATDVSVSLHWSDLLHRELRLRQASADRLSVNPARWPGNDNPWPTDYSFLDPYLPDQLRLENGLYIATDRHYPVAAAHWRRQGDSASLDWQYTLDGVPVVLEAKLQSLPDLLRLARLQLELAVTAQGKADSRISGELTIQPGTAGGYQLSARVAAAALQARIDSGNKESWALPEQSTTHIKTLDIHSLRVLLDNYDQADPSPATEDLPRLDLPTHQGQLTIDEIRWHKQVRTGNVLEFTTGAEGVTLPSFASHGAAGDLSGSARLGSSASGWRLDLIAQVKAAEASQGLATPFLDSQWSWHAGRARITAEGSNWQTLLNTLQGEIDLQGSHRGEQETPVIIAAQLDNRPNELALETLDIQLAGGQISGSASLSGNAPRRLSGKLSARHLDLNTLLPPTPEDDAAGVALPAFLQALPDMDLDWQLDVSDLQLRQLPIERGAITLQRTDSGGLMTLEVQSAFGGSADLRLQARRAAGETIDLELEAALQQANLPKLFRQESTLTDSRTSGIIKASGSGSNPAEIFAALRGTAELNIDFRQDHDWQRPPRPEEQLKISGVARPVMAEDRITGLDISALKVDSLQQNLTGNLSMVDGRKPWLIATLESEKLDIPALLATTSSQQAGDNDTDDLSALRKLGDARLSLKARSLQLSKALLSDVDLQIDSRSGQLAVDRLDFAMQGGTFKSHGAISWRDTSAALSVDAQVVDLPIDDFLDEKAAARKIPVSGTLSLQSEGGTVAELLGDLNGSLELASSPDPGDPQGSPARKVSMTARRIPDGMQATIRSLQWGDTDLRGSVVFHDTTPPRIEVQLDGGKLSLLPWEDVDKPSPDAAAKPQEDSLITRTARAGLDMVGDVVLAPLRLLSGPREAEPGDKIFSKDPLPLSWIKEYQLEIRGKLDSLESIEARASDLELTVAIEDGQLSAEARAAAFNRGAAWIKVQLDASQQPASLHLNGEFRNLQGPVVKAAIPRSGYFDVRSQGDSQAALAAAVDGLIYLELGSGPLDYSKLMLLTADVATAAFDTLIPGSREKQPELECALTLGVFKDGKGITPYGYAARTRQANLVGKVELDLKTEIIHMNFSSSSRKGVGMSVGNVFSNTIEIEGALSDPKIIPDATGLLWRGWAAILTGGLSIVGESVLKRALASENPCTSVQKHIRKDLCGSEQPAAQSPLICPPGPVG